MNGELWRRNQKELEEEINNLSLAKTSKEEQTKEGTKRTRTPEERIEKIAQTFRANSRQTRKAYFYRKYHKSCNRRQVHTNTRNRDQYKEVGYFHGRKRSEVGSCAV